MLCKVYRHLPNTVKKEAHIGILVFLSILPEDSRSQGISPYSQHLLNLLFLLITQEGVVMLLLERLCVLSRCGKAGRNEVLK